MSKVVCPYCKSEIDVDAAVGTVICRYCGASFVVNEGSSFSNDSSEKKKSFTESILDQIDEKVDGLKDSVKEKAEDLKEEMKEKTDMHFSGSDSSKDSGQQKGQKKKGPNILLIAGIVLILLVLLIFGNKGKDASTEKGKIQDDALYIEIPNVIGMTPEAADEALKNAGFSDVSFENNTGVGTIAVREQEPEAGTKVNSTDKLTLICAEQYTVSFELESVLNLLFSKYKIEVTLDGEKVASIENGKSFQGEKKVFAGKHTLAFLNEENNDISTAQELNVDGDIIVKCRLAHSSSAISTEGFQIVPAVNTDDVYKEAVGTYVGENNSLLVLFDNGTAYYYYDGLLLDTEEDGIYWRKNGDVIEWSSIKMDCLVTADVTSGDCSTLFFKSDSSNWDDERYVKIDNKAVKVDSTQAKSIIRDTLAAGRFTADGTFETISETVSTEPSVAPIVETQPQTNKETEATSEVAQDDEEITIYNNEDFASFMTLTDGFDDEAAKRFVRKNKGKEIKFDGMIFFTNKCDDESGRYYDVYMMHARPTDTTVCQHGCVLKEMYVPKLKNFVKNRKKNTVDIGDFYLVTGTVEGYEASQHCIIIDLVSLEPNVTLEKPSESKETEPAEKETTAESTSNDSKYDLAYVRDCGEYKMYYLFDTKEKEVIQFSTNDTSVMHGTYSGDFDSAVKIHWVVSGEEWNTRVRRKSKGDDSVLLDALDGDDFWADYQKTKVPTWDSHLK